MFLSKVVETLEFGKKGKKIMSTKPWVVHCKRLPFDVYIGRPSIWGNPYVIGKDGSRDEVIEKYERYLVNNPQLMSKLGELRGKRLGCWCAPQRCHGDVLAKYANA